MPLQLTTPINTGDLDPNAATYTQVRIVKFCVDSVNEMFELITQEGNTVNNVWVAGVPRSRRFIIMDMKDENGDPIAGQQYYTDMVNKTMADASMTATDPIYDGVAYHLYDWLINHSGYVGTYV